MSSGHATHEGEEIKVEFSAKMQKSDYGVDRSPVWYEVEDVEIDTLEILGVAVDPKTLSKELVEAIHALADDLEFELS